MPATYFDSSTLIIGLILAGRWLEARARSSTAGAVRALMALQAPIAHRIDLDPATGVTVDIDVPVAQVRVGRAAAGPRRRDGPGRRRARRGCLERRRVDAHGRVDARGTCGRRPGHRGHPERQRQLRDARHAGGQRHRPGPDRAHGRDRPGIEGAHRTPGGPDQRPVRARGHRAGGDHLRGLAGRRAAALGDARHGRRHLRAHHRVPVCDGSRDADGDHGRHRTGRGVGHPHPGRRSPGGCRRGRHGRVRQDGHPDAGPAGGGSRRGRGGHER